MGKIGFGGKAPLYRGEKDLTTSILEKLKNRRTVSKQFIFDLSKAHGLKNEEREIVLSALESEGNTVVVNAFSKKVTSQLLQLKHYQPASKYYDFVLPQNIRGRVFEYSERVYASDISTSAGKIHFNHSDHSLKDKYFGHTRFEDMSDKITRRILEIQSDLYQKDGLESEVAKKLQSEISKSYDEIEREIDHLRQYANPSAHFRMIREEIRAAAKDGKKQLQFPTGETAMKIEGLGETDVWSSDPSHGPYQIDYEWLLDRGIGSEIFRDDERWVVTELLGEGRFRAVPKDVIENEIEQLNNRPTEAQIIALLKHKSFAGQYRYTETFDISGKVDANNPIYKFYEKDIGRYLKTSYNAKMITDVQEVNWWEIPVNTKAAKEPVMAFEDNFKHIQKEKTMTTKDENIPKKKSRLENFDTVLRTTRPFEAPYPEPERTGLPGLINALEKPLRELQAERKKDRKRDIDMGEDKDFELEL